MRDDKLISARLFVGIVFSGVALLIIVSTTLIFTDGLLNQYVANLKTEQRQLYLSMRSDRDNHGKLYSSDCRFQVKKIDKKLFSRFEDCKKRYGPGLLVIGDSHSMNLYNALLPSLDKKFYVGIGRGGFRPTSVNAIAEFNLLLNEFQNVEYFSHCLLYTSPSPRDRG